MSRIKMMDNVIKKFGFEDKRTRGFCYVCEHFLNYNTIKIAYKLLMREKV